MVAVSHWQQLAVVPAAVALTPPASSCSAAASYVLQAAREHQAAAVETDLHPSINAS